MTAAPLKLLLLAVCVAVVLPALAADEPPLRNTIDQQLTTAWQREKIAPAPLASDAAFLRRVYLDLGGIIPTYEETKRFLDDTDPDKRAKLIDRLLDDPRYAIHQADVWDLVLFGGNPPGNETDKRAGFQKWLREQFAKNVPYDQWARAILKAEGNSLDDGPSMYLVQFDRQPEDATEAITQTFLGVQLQCARCHDHPFDEWTQNDFYGMAAFLARLSTVQVGAQGQLKKFAIGEKNSRRHPLHRPGEGRGARQEGRADQAEVPARRRAGRAARHRQPEGREVRAEQDAAARQVLAQGQAGRVDHRQDNPYFARAVANRVWAQFMGRGIVHPVDNLSQSQRASHPELLDALAKQFSDRQFDLKWLIREICNSQTYQLAAAGPARSRSRSGSSAPASGRCRPKSWSSPGAWRRATMSSTRRRPRTASRA